MFSEASDSLYFCFFPEKKAKQMQQPMQKQWAKKRRKKGIAHWLFKPAAPFFVALFLLFLRGVFAFVLHLFYFFPKGPFASFFFPEILLFLKILEVAIAHGTRQGFPLLFQR